MMPVMVPEKERFVLDGIALSRMQSAILLFVFQRRAEERVRGEVVPNGEAVAVVLPAAGAAAPDFFPASGEVAMSKMLLAPDCFAVVLPGEEDGTASPGLDWAKTAQATAMQKEAVSAMRILMCPFLSGEGKPSTIVVPGYAPARGSRSVLFVLRRRGPPLRQCPC